MPAQSGSSILLQYGNQGAQQLGSAVLLSYDPPAVEGATPIGKAIRAPWIKSRTKMRGLDSRHVAVARLDQERAANWVASTSVDSDERIPWNRIATVDDRSTAAWSAFGAMLNAAHVSFWSTAIRKDDQRNSAWGAFGPMVNAIHGAQWKGSRAADAQKTGGWHGYFIPTYRPIAYVPPNNDEVNFTVVGGSPLVAQLPGTPAGTDLPLLIEFGPEIYTPHFLGDPRRNLPGTEWNHVNFTTGNTGVELVLDGLGAPKLSPSARDTTRLNPWGLGRAQDDITKIPWVRFSRVLDPGWGIPSPGGPLAPEPGAPIIIPVRRVYLVINEIMLLRVSGNVPIDAINLNVSFDCDSWLPSFSATIPESAREIVTPDTTPVEVAAHINGTEFRFLVERIQRNRQFGSRSVSISGRGVACELDAPYAPETQHTNSSAMTAQQIIDAALVGTGYSQAWNITDWLVPENAFSRFGSPAAVAADVAEASGSVLAADWSLRELRMLPRYPVKPWEWNTTTPEYQIPIEITQTESLEWFEKPAYNVVYVSGTQQGVLGQVKITGTAGDYPAPMVTHPLITHLDAARQRGITILSGTGRGAIMQLSIPISDETGIIDICRFVQINDGANTRRGIVRANNISVNFPTVRQNLTIEVAA